MPLRGKKFCLSVMTRSYAEKLPDKIEGSENEERYQNERLNQQAGSLSQKKIKGKETANRGQTQGHHNTRNGAGGHGEPDEKGPFEKKRKGTLSPNTEWRTTPLIKRRRLDGSWNLGE